jgi:hypothetical protein
MMVKPDCCIEKPFLAIGGWFLIAKTQQWKIVPCRSITLIRRHGAAWPGRQSGTDEEIHHRLEKGRKGRIGFTDPKRRKPRIFELLSASATNSLTMSSCFIN